MKKFLFTLFSGLFIFASSYSQVIVMDIVQVKDGMNAQYEAVEKFAEPIKREAVKMGKQLGWYIMKRKSGGDLSELENKGIGDYIILNIFKDEAQMKSGMDWNAIAKKVYKGKMSSRSIEKKLGTLGAPRKDTRSYTLENIYYTKPGQANRGETVYISLLKLLMTNMKNTKWKFLGQCGKKEYWKVATNIGDLIKLPKEVIMHTRT